MRAPGRRASCSGVAAKVARRSRTICQGGRFRRQPGNRRDLAPDGLRERLPRRVDQAIAGADRHRDAARERKDPFRGGVDDAQIGGRSGGRIDAEMRIHDRAVFIRRLEAGNERGRHVGWHRQDDGVVAGER